MRFYTLIFALLALTPAWGSSLLVVDSQGNALAQAMVTSTPQQQAPADLSDDGYAPHGVTNTAPAVVTRFTDTTGRVSMETPDQPARYRVRAQGYVDAYLTELPDELVMQPMTPEQLVASYPSNVWLSQLDFDGDEALKKRFFLNCAFCHQQASPFMRNERSEEQWISVIERMNTYGARLPEDDHQRIARGIHNQHGAAPGRCQCQ
jgi:virginiamycin B lyase